MRRSLCNFLFFLKKLGCQRCSHACHDTDKYRPYERSPCFILAVIKELNLEWPEWKCLNRMRKKMGRCRANMARWGYAHEEDTLCDCIETQTMDHILQCGRTGCTDEDLALVNETAIAAMHERLMSVIFCLYTV